MNSCELTQSEREQIVEILNRRANEIRGFSREYTENPNHFGSVELALSREVNRLRQLSTRIMPPPPVE